MELTHAQAREMIQFDADAALGADSLRILKAHLASCVACRLYADSIYTMENHLRRSMTRRWGLHPAPLALDVIKSNSHSRSIHLSQLATRFTVIASAVLIFIVATLGITNATIPGGDNQTPLNVPLIPTPSVQSTSTQTDIVPECGQIQYTVQADDTLESIANKFSISRSDLMAANKLNSETVIAGAEMIIPLCNSTPTGTVNPPTFTSTITPLTELISRTPDG